MRKLLAIAITLSLAIICGYSKTESETAQSDAPATAENSQTDTWESDYIADLNLQPRGIIGEEEPIEYTYNHRFSYEEAIKDVNGIRDMLCSFTNLTEESRNIIPKEKMARIDYTSREAQTLGFRNVPNAVEGALRKQQYLIKKLRYDLAQYKLKSGEINKDQFKEIETEYQQERASFLDFWDSFWIAD